MSEPGGSAVSREHNHIAQEGVFVSDCPVCVAMDAHPNGGSGAGSTVRDAVYRWLDRITEPLDVEDSRFLRELLNEYNRTEELVAIMEAQLRTDFEAARAEIEGYRQWELANGMNVAFVSQVILPELREARARMALLEQVASAAVRLRADKYVRWENAGGPNECAHGRAAGIPCPHCDQETLAALDGAQAAAGTPYKAPKPSTYTVEQVRHILETNGQLLDRISHIGRKLDRWGGIDAALAKVELIDAVLEMSKQVVARFDTEVSAHPMLGLNPGEADNRELAALRTSLEALAAASGLNRAQQRADVASEKSDSVPDVQRGETRADAHSEP